MKISDHVGPFAWIPTSLLDQDVPPMTIRLYAELSLLADSRFRVGPVSRSYLAERLGVTVRQVDRAKKELDERGYLHIDSGWKERGANRYVLLPAPDRATQMSLDQDTNVSTARDMDVSPSRGTTESNEIPSGSGQKDAAVLVVEYSEKYAATHAGKQPSRAWRNQLGSHAKRLLAEGHDYEDVQRAMWGCVNDNKAPSALEHVLSDYLSEKQETT